MHSPAARRRALLAVGCAVLLALLAGPSRSEEAVDPQSLVGQWGGSWTDKASGKLTGQYWLTIDRVRGRRVFGEVEASGPPRSAKFKFAGTLDGNRLRFTSGSAVTELTVHGQEMRGGTALRAFNLTKRK